MQTHHIIFAPLPVGEADEREQKVLRRVVRRSAAPAWMKRIPRFLFPVYESYVCTAGITKNTPNSGGNWNVRTAAFQNHSVRATASRVSGIGVGTWTVVRLVAGVSVTTYVFSW